MMDNVKLTTNIEYRYPFNEMFEGAVFADAGNIWSTKDSGIGMMNLSSINLFLKWDWVLVSG